MRKLIQRIERRHIREVFVYGIVGASAWIIQTTIFLICIRLKVFPSVAMVVGNLGGLIVAYFGHIRFTFQKTHRFSRNEFAKFMITSFIGLCINVIGVRLITKVLLLDPHYGIIPTIFTPGVTFLISKFWAFKE